MSTSDAGTATRLSAVDLAAGRVDAAARLSAGVDVAAGRVDAAARLFAGVDVAAGRVDAALVSSNGSRLELVSVFDGPLAGLADYCRPAGRVAVDAPGGPSTGAHLGDLSVAPKFRSGRCSEIPVPGVPPVPWVTPLPPGPAPGWMRTGFEAWQALIAAGLAVVETFPAALFHRLNGRRWPPPKSTAAGLAARLSLLSDLVSLPTALEWTHDRVDAVACAVVAALGRPAGHDCDRPDGSAMWLLP